MSTGENMGESVTLSEDPSKLAKYIPEKYTNAFLVTDLFNRINDKIRGQESPGTAEGGSSGDESSEGELSNCKNILSSLVMDGVKLARHGVEETRDSAKEAEINTTLVRQWKVAFRLFLSAGEGKDIIVAAMRSEQKLEDDGIKTHMEWGDKVSLAFIDMAEEIESTWSSFKELGEDGRLGLLLVLFMAAATRFALKGAEMGEEHEKDRKHFVDKMQRTICEAFAGWQLVDYLEYEAKELAKVYRRRGREPENQGDSFETSSPNELDEENSQSVEKS